MTLSTEEGEEISGSQSQVAAREGISKVVFSRMGMAAPGMVRTGRNKNKYIQKVINGKAVSKTTKQSLSREQECSIGTAHEG